MLQMPRDTEVVAVREERTRQCEYRRVLLSIYWVSAHAPYAA